MNLVEPLTLFWKYTVDNGILTLPSHLPSILLWILNDPNLRPMTEPCETFHHALEIY